VDDALLPRLRSIASTSMSPPPPPPPPPPRGIDDAHERIEAQRESYRV
jgi:hypothetical protein